MARRRSEIVSIFGQIEEVIATQMMAEGTGITKFAPTETVSITDLPLSTRFNEHGHPVRLVIVVPPHLKHEFEERIANLRA